jgi:hypothetical protein
MENIDINTSIKKNYLSWILIFISVIIVSYPLVSAGFITFFILLLLAYFLHRFSHNYKNVLTILHHYHHENTNFFSHFSQILLELSFIMLVIPFYNLFGDENYFIDIWTAVLFILFYSTVHNYNYGQLRVNEVHYQHHTDIYTNIGPDICDVAFGTKHPDNKEVENTNHYIPNLIIITIFIAFTKYYLFSFDELKMVITTIFKTLLKISTLFIALSSIYLYYTYIPKN